MQAAKDQREPQLMESLKHERMSTLQNQLQHLASFHGPAYTEVVTRCGLIGPSIASLQWCLYNCFDMQLQVSPMSQRLKQ